jgi:hypothetical protein
LSTLGRTTCITFRLVFLALLKDGQIGLLLDGRKTPEEVLVVAPDV